jgi:secreted trypsin-like serine protease
MPIVDFYTCLQSDRDFFGSVLAPNIFCAGKRGGRSVCNGDSGGGLVIEDAGRFTLRGIVSFSPVRRNDDNSYCDPNAYVGFTDVAHHLNWIEEKLKYEHVEFKDVNCGSRSGNWPFHAAVFEYKEMSSKFKCGATLIGRQFVVTAASCVGNNQKESDILVHLGKTFVNRFTESAREFEVSEIIRNGKLVLLKLATEVGFDSFIQPACIDGADQEDTTRVSKVSVGSTLEDPAKFLVTKMDIKRVEGAFIGTKSNRKLKINNPFPSFF